MFLLIRSRGLCVGAEARTHPSIKSTRTIPRQAETGLPISLSALWVRRVGELERFVARHGRMPYSRTEHLEEASLGRWLARQRKAAQNGDLALVKTLELNAVGCWQESARRQQDRAHWSRRLEGVCDFLRETSRLPSYRQPESGLERVLGNWLHAQRQRAHQGRMPKAQSEELDVAVPGWNTWTTPPVMAAAR